MTCISVSITFEGMTLLVREIDQVNEMEAKKIFEWETDRNNKLFCEPCKGPNETSKYKSWQDLQIRLNKPGAHRFGIYDDKEFVGEFNFIFDHPALLKKEPKSAWIGIGIGDSKYRRMGAGTMAMATMERAVKALGGRRMELGVFAFNEPAILFYEKLGYRRFSELKDFTWWEGKWWSDFRYEKFLV